MRVTQVKGVKEVLANFKKANKDMAQRVERGLVKGGQFIQRESMKLCPVQTGTLRASAFTRKTGRGIKADVTVGYTAKYAAYVHENLDAAHGKVFNQKYADRIANAKGSQKKYWFKRGPNQQAKFLERPSREKKNEVIRIIVHETKKK